VYNHLCLSSRLLDRFGIFLIDYLLYLGDGDVGEADWLML
jgi:hypothetical protein